MRKAFFTPAIAFVLILLLAVPQPAGAWGAAGHQAVAFIAWHQLTDATKARIVQLLPLVPNRSVTTHAGKTTIIPGYASWLKDLPAGLTDDQQHMYLFMRAATWADTIKHVGLYDTDNPAQEKAGEDPAANLGFTDTSSHGYWHFIDSPFGTVRTRSAKSAVPSNRKLCKTLPAPVARLPATPAPNVGTQIDALRTDLGSSEDDLLKAYDLVWVEHLVGDIHQPLHASVRFASGVPDEGGNCVSLHLTSTQNAEFKRTNATARPPVELHAFWDDLPGIAAPDQPALAISFATPLPPADDALAADTDVSHWAAESLAMAKKDAYAAPIGKALGAPTPYNITDPYYSKTLKDAQVRIALAGARLARLLNDNLK